jgi:hypothetical protein
MPSSEGAMITNDLHELGSNVRLQKVGGYLAVTYIAKDLAYVVADLAKVADIRQRDHPRYVSDSAGQSCRMGPSGGNRCGVLGNMSSHQSGPQGPDVNCKLRWNMLLFEDGQMSIGDNAR